MFLEPIYVTQLGALKEGPEQIPRLFPTRAVLGENPKTKKSQYSLGSYGLLAIIFEIERKHGAEVFDLDGAHGLSKWCSVHKSASVLRELLCIKLVEMAHHEGVMLCKLEVFSPRIQYPWEPMRIFVRGQATVLIRFVTQIPSKKELMAPHDGRNQPNNRKKDVHGEFDTFSARRGKSTSMPL